MQNALADTGIWYGMFDPSDPYHKEARGKALKLSTLRIVLPWPTLYETLRTKFVRNSLALSQLDRFLKGPNIEFLDDSALRVAALDLTLESSLRSKRPLSMVDCLIRLLLDDVNTRVSYLATLNVRDFADACRKRGVEMI
jgi:predicted nucleic acid-binding protein